MCSINKLTISILSNLVIMVLCTFCAKKDPSPNSSSSSTTATEAVVIQSGAKVIQPGQSITLSANLVDAQGNVVPASSITWSSSNTNIASINGNVLTANGTGQVVVTATYTSNGTTSSSQVIYGIAQPTTLFTVLPQAIVWTTNSGTIDLNPVYFGSSSPSFTYSSSNPSVVTVDANGVVSFVGTGTANIAVKATGLNGSPEVDVPVLVLGTPSIPLPVEKVVLTPGSSQIFKGQTLQLTATAYNSSNSQVTATVAWALENDTNNVRPNAMSINQSGLVTAKYEGFATIYATIMGVRAQAQVQVLPDSVLIITPYYVSANAGATQQFTANLYQVSRTTKQIVNSPLTLPSNLTWNIPSFSQYVPALSIFDIATVDANGLVTVKSNATTGFSTAIQAYIPGSGVGGAALLSVGTGGLSTNTSHGLGTVTLPSGI